MKSDDTMADWRGLLVGKSQAQRFFSAEHPLDLVYGIDGEGRALMALMTDTPPPVQDLSDDVRVHQQTREDGRHVTTWSLMEHQLFDTFVTLCCDVVQRSDIPEDRNIALDALLRGLGEWQLLLRPGQFRRLSLEALRGLVAELLVANRTLTADRDLPEVMAHWTGPLGAPQDFTFLTGELHEVKAKRMAGTSVRVASVEQLDPPVDKTLTLHVIDLDERSNDTEGVVSLASLVDEIRAGLATSSSVRLRFDRLLTGLGVDLTDDWYGATWFKPGAHSQFRVSPDFPSLRSSALQPHILQVRYKLDIQHLAPWTLDHGTADEEAL